jgi:hypothetical protein
MHRLLGLGFILLRVGWLDEILVLFSFSCFISWSGVVDERIQLGDFLADNDSSRDVQILCFWEPSLLSFTLIIELW